MDFSRVILDASVTLEWFVSDKTNIATHADDAFNAFENREILPLVSDLWHYEVGSFLIAAKRARRINAQRLNKAVDALNRLRPYTINTPILHLARLTSRPTNLFCFSIQASAKPQEPQCH